MAVPTGIRGLDDLISGGFPENTINLVAGPSGSGKTLLAMQFIYNGVKDYDEPGIYMAVEESRNNLERLMSNFKMDWNKYEGEGKLVLLDLGEIRRKCGVEREMEYRLVGFDAIESVLKHLLEVTKAKRLVIDSIGGFGLHYPTLEELRKEAFQFGRFLKERNLTTVLVTESIEGKDLTRYGFEQFITDSFIVLGLEIIKGELRRTLLIRKMRFTAHDTSIHPFLITRNGIEVSPEVHVY